jgi:hypothetical protein
MMEIKVNLDASPKLVECITGLTAAIQTLAGKKPGKSESEIARELLRTGGNAKSDSAKLDETTPIEEQKKLAEKIVARLDEAAAACSQPEEEGHHPDKEEKELTTQDIREAMDDVRKRIETDADAKERYHKKLSGMFRAVAEGIEPGKKPSELSSQTGRKEFIERIAHIVLNSGELIEEPPF